MSNASDYTSGCSASRNQIINDDIPLSLSIALFLILAACPTLLMGPSDNDDFLVKQMCQDEAYRRPTDT
jgi:hypothetical protein